MRQSGVVSETVMSTAMGRARWRIREEHRKTLDAVDKIESREGKRNRENFAAGLMEAMKILEEELGRA